MSDPRTVLFICVENAARSLMAEAMFNARAPTGWRAVSAGTRPAARAHPRTAPMLGELGLSLPSHPPRVLTPGTMESASVRVTMGCLDDASCPARLHTLTTRDWALADPAPLDDAGFRRVRDDLLRRVTELTREISGRGPRSPTARGRSLA